MSKLKFDYLDGWYDVYYKRTNEWIGVIEFDTGWKKWVWKQHEDIQMSWDCLLEVVDFIKGINKK